MIKESMFEPPKPTTQQANELKDLMNKDKKFLFLIYQPINDPDFERIPRSKSSNRDWDVLYMTYGGEDRVKEVCMQTLSCELDGLKRKESETI